MDINHKIEEVKKITEQVKGFFGENVCNFYTETEENEENFVVKFIVYKMFSVCMGVGFENRGRDEFSFGVVDINVEIGSRFVSLNLLNFNEEKTSMKFSREGIIHNLELLDKYLQWRMTEEQKKTFKLV